ncbi:MAG TPA: hypothetical protein VMT22_19950 [Terriglobales bacterium]|jgi:hypothetical protein|nr:hypothetical protein [Terriglobales bacterium]
MIITVMNLTQGELLDEEVQHAIRAINRQIKEGFEPYWSLGATLRLEGKSTSKPKLQPADMRGDAILHLRVKTNVDDALGYHDTYHRGIPCGFVFTELSDALEENWTVTLSHGALELIGDPEVNSLVMGRTRNIQSEPFFTGTRCAMRCRMRATISTASKFQTLSCRYSLRAARSTGGATIFSAPVTAVRRFVRSASIRAAMSVSTIPERGSTRPLS